MTISKIVTLAEPKLTAQQIIDLALTEWQAARLAALRGDREIARAYRAEALRLCDLSHLVANI